VRRYLCGSVHCQASSLCVGHSGILFLWICHCYVLSICGSVSVRHYQCGSVTVTYLCGSVTATYLYGSVTEALPPWIGHCDLLSLRICHIISVDLSYFELFLIFFLFLSLFNTLILSLSKISVTVD
jgi:hypothetical protein